MFKKLMRARQFNIRYKIVIDAISRADSPRAQNLLESELRKLKTGYFK